LVAGKQDNEDSEKNERKFTFVDAYIGLCNGLSPDMVCKFYNVGRCSIPIATSDCQVLGKYRHEVDVPDNHTPLERCTLLARNPGNECLKTTREEIVFLF
jgi:hypothetical protein